MKDESKREDPTTNTQPQSYVNKRGYSATPESNGSSSSSSRRRSEANRPTTDRTANAGEHAGRAFHTVSHRTYRDHDFPYRAVGIHLYIHPSCAYISYIHTYKTPMSDQIFAIDSVDYARTWGMYVLYAGMYAWGRS